MGYDTELTASDGHRLGAYRADPEGTSKGGIVVLQEIFGVNRHIRAVCDRLAAAGYAAIAPALFDRKEPGFESGYSPDEIAAARRFLAEIDWQALLADTDAAAKALRHDGHAVGVMGFCLGGSVAFLAATRLEGFAASVCYYGGAIARFAEEKPRCPTQMHFGEQDHTIPMADVERIRAARPDCDIHVYSAGHGFNCDERGSYEAASAELAWKRSLGWFADAFAKAS